MSLITSFQDLTAVIKQSFTRINTILTKKIDAPSSASNGKCSPTTVALGLRLPPAGEELPLLYPIPLRLTLPMVCCG